MKEWTVVLMRDDALQDALEGLDSRQVAADGVYVAVGIKADSTVQAVIAAKEQVIVHDTKDAHGFKPEHENYSLLVMFEGAHDVALFGRQPH